MRLERRLHLQGDRVDGDPADHLVWSSVLADPIAWLLHSGLCASLDLGPSMNLPEVRSGWVLAAAAELCCRDLTHLCRHGRADLTARQSDGFESS
jgi:hypothetical protein